MTRLKRCTHCGIRYEHLESGHSVTRDLSTGTHCDSCAEAQRDVLKGTSRLFEGRWRPIAEITEVPAFKEITLDRLLTWEKARDRGMGQRIFVGLYNLETGDSQNSRGIVVPPPPVAEDYIVSKGPDAPYRGILFKVTTWRKDPEFSIEVEREWDIQEGKFTGQKWP